MPSGRAPIQHDLKCHPEYFAALAAGLKTFEIRINDRDFQVGDTIHNREWHPVDESYSGRSWTQTITYILRGPVLGLDAGWCIMGLSRAEYSCEMLCDSDSVTALCFIKERAARRFQVRVLPEPYTPGDLTGRT